MFPLILCFHWSYVRTDPTSPPMPCYHWSYVSTDLLWSLTLCSHWSFVPADSMFSQILSSNWSYVPAEPDVISLKEKQMGCIWRITCLGEDVLNVFRRDLARHDSESDKIVSPHWVVVVSPMEYTRKQQVENLKNTHRSFSRKPTDLMFSLNLCV